MKISRIIFAIVALELSVNYAFRLADATLKDAFKNDFDIGVALNARQFSGLDPKAHALIRQQFNSISPEDALKWRSVHPARGKYTFDVADKYVEFGVKNGLGIVGHTLIWHSHTDPWISVNEKGEQLNRDEMLHVMKEHITTVMGRYRGKIKGWDVVNEAFNEDGTYRNSKWHEIIGEDFIVKAYEYAHEADPSAELYYNDYNLFKPAKRAAVVKLLKKLKEKNIPLKGVGEQGHYYLQTPTVAEVEAAVLDLASTGYPVSITELDVNVLPKPAGQLTAEVSATLAYDEKWNPYVKGLPDTTARKLAHKYSTLFAMFHKHRDKIARVTFWGLTDGDSWLNGYPIKGRTNYPLLFDRDYQPKRPVFDDVVRVVK